MDEVIGRVHETRQLHKAWYALPFVLALALLIGLYATTFTTWWWVWTESGSFYAHAMFVPVFVGMMAWRNREHLAAADWRPTWLGLIPISLAMVFLLIGKDSEVRMVQSLSFILLLIGGMLLLGGIPKTRVLIFPLLFVLTMIPLIPDQLINVIAFPVQMWSVKIATTLLNVMQLSAKAEGAMIQMDSYKMMVGGACSGFRTLLSLTTFAAAFAYLIEGALWKRWTLFLLTAPLSLLINGLRITLIGMVGELISTPAAATFHDYSGLIVLLLAFWILFQLARVLRCDRFLGVPLRDDKAPAPLAEVENSPEADATPWWKEMLNWRPSTSQLKRSMPFILALDLMLLLTLAVQGRVFAKVTPLPPIATTQVPEKLSADNITYTALPGPLYDKLDKYTHDQLKPTRAINRDYNGTDGSELSFFLTAGNLRHTFHDPHNCSLGNDATLQDIGVITIQTKSGPLQVLETAFKHNGVQDKYEMMFCYLVDGKVLPRTEQVHQTLLLQTIFGNSEKPSYFLRFTQRIAGTGPDSRKQLIHFVSTMWDQISPVLLGKTPAIPEAPPVPVDEGVGG